MNLVEILVMKLSKDKLEIYKSIPKLASMTVNEAPAGVAEKMPNAEIQKRSISFDITLPQKVSP